MWGKLVWMWRECLNGSEKRSGTMVCSACCCCYLFIFFFYSAVEEKS